MQNEMLQSDYRGKAHSFPTNKREKKLIKTGTDGGTWGKLDGLGSHLYTRKHFTKHTFKSLADALYHYYKLLVVHQKVYI